MKYLSGIPFFEMAFTKDGAVHDEAELSGLLEGIGSEAFTDLIIISHGWNNDMAEALDLYTRMFGFVAEELEHAGLEGRKFGVLGIYWPSKKFAEQSLIAGGAASADDPNDAIITQLDNLKGFFDGEAADDHLLQIRSGLYDQLDTDQLYSAFVKLFAPVQDKTGKEPVEDASQEVNQDNIKDLLVALQFTAVEPAADPGQGGAADVGSFDAPVAGSAAGLFSGLGGLKDGVLNMLNLVTYYQMKNRAGVVGSLGLNKVIRRIKASNSGLRLHLIGHSFGARLVTAAIAGATENDANDVQSLTLLQAAFSHYSFAKNFDGSQDGFFRRVVTNQHIKGSFVISHTVNDKAVGLAYAIASRAARQVGSALGDENDFYGGLGRNGAQKTPEANNLVSLELGFPYSFESGTICNLKADTTIDGHSGIKNKAVAQVIVAAVR